MTEINYKELIEETSSQQNEFLKTKESLVALGFSTRTQNCLYNGGIVNLEDLLNKTPKDLVRIPNLGRRSILEIENSLRELNIKELIKTVYSAKINKNKVSSKHQKILDMWNSGEHTLESIGKIIGVTRERIRQILKKLEKKGFEVISVKTAHKVRRIKFLNDQSAHINEVDFIEMYHSGTSKKEISNKFLISSDVYNHYLKLLINRGLVSERKRILNYIKFDIENIDNLSKYREETIFLLREKNYKLNDIANELGLSKIAVSLIIKRMKDKGYEIPNSTTTGSPLSEEELTSRLNKIDHCLDKGMNVRQISHVTNISPHTIKRLIYKYLIEK